MRGKVRRIGLAIDAVAAYGRGVIRGIMSFCRANPHWLISVEPLWSFATPPDIATWDVDGLIVQTFSRAFEDRVLARGLPATNVSNFAPGAMRLPTIVPDDLAVGRMAAEYLLSLGFRDVGFCWPGDMPYGELRLQAFRAAAEEAHARFHECNVARQDLHKWISELPKPIGVLGCNDDWAHRLLNTVRGRVHVPDEMAIIGVDDDELINSLVTPSLSSISLPVEQIGYEAAAQLDRLMNKKKLKSELTRLPPLQIVPRESTDVLSVEDPDVVQAIRFIRDNASKPLQVDDVLEQVPLSRRSLERRFRQIVGHSISTEIRRAHIEKAKQLLITTDLLMPQIATASGFTNATRLGIVFHRDVGEPPTTFRRRARAGWPLKRG